MIAATATVDEILVFIYRKHDRVLKRNAVQEALYRMRDVGDVRRKQAGVWELVR